MSLNISSIHKSRFVIGIVAAIVLFIATNILFNYFLTNARLDLTENELYTLSEGMRKTIEKIDEPITLRLYFSDKLQRAVPTFGVYGTRVKDFLTEIADLSKGKVKLRVLDPEPFSEVEDEAVGLGLQGVPIDNAGTKVYFGLVGTNMLDTKEIIPFFQPEKEKFLEYDLARLVGNLANPKRKVVGILSSIALEQPAQGQMPWMIVNQIRETFITRTLFNPLKEIEDDVDILMLVHPVDLPDDTLYAIDQYLLRGGKMIAFVDPHSDYNAMQAGPPNPYAPPQPDAPKLSSDLYKLFDHWGIELEPQKVVGDIALAQKVNMGAQGEMNVIQYLPWIKLTKNNFNKEDLVTSDLKTINMASAGHLKKLDKSSLEFTPLMTSSTESALIDTKELKGQPDPEKLLKNFVPSGEKYNLAARLRGKITTLFPDGRPKKTDDAQPPTTSDEHSAEKPFVKEGTLNAIIVADTDFLENRFWVQVQNFFGQPLMTSLANNADFVINALDNLSGSDELISLRSRGLSARPFTLVQKLQDEAEKNYKAQAEALRAKLIQAERQIADLQSADGDGKILSHEQQSAIENFRQEAVVVRRELRKVQLALRQDIRSLEKWVEFLNIGFIPLLVFIFAIFFGVLRARRQHAKTA
ncbi:MAG: Gldg family protein [Alphaproteobacteria bacterium]|nr:Gldg family protein [Alphaproteobacteria bacterium]